MKINKNIHLSNIKLDEFSESFDFGMKSIITHSSQEYVNDIEIMVMKKYIG